MRAVGKLFPVVLVGACVMAVLSSAARTQVPFVQVQMDDDAYPSATNCKPPNTFDTLIVNVHNLNAQFVGFELSIQYPPALLFLDDLVDADSYVGSSLDGITITWLEPQEGFGVVELFRVRVIWTGACNCNEGVVPVNVYGRSGTGSPRVVRWPDLDQVDVAGLHSLVCGDGPPISVEDTTWGAIKALYR